MCKSKFRNLVLINTWNQSICFKLAPTSKVIVSFRPQDCLHIVKKINWVSILRRSPVGTFVFAADSMINWCVFLKDILFLSRIISSIVCNTSTLLKTHILLQQEKRLISNTDSTLFNSINTPSFFHKRNSKILCNLA